MNSRRITADIIINAPLENVWKILTDYNNLATHVPNLIQSRLIPNRENKIRLYQEGAQKIIGFDFRAALTMDMTEVIPGDCSARRRELAIKFKCVESSMFNIFDGSWRVQYHSRVRDFDPVVRQFVHRYKTRLTYSVTVQPRGPVPVFALEWRIKEDVPVNLWAVKVAAERLPQEELVVGGVLGAGCDDEDCGGFGDGDADGNGGYEAEERDGEKFELGFADSGTDKGADATAISKGKDRGNRERDRIKGSSSNSNKRRSSSRGLLGSAWQGWREDETLGSYSGPSNGLISRIESNAAASTEPSRGGAWFKARSLNINGANSISSPMSVLTEGSQEQSLPKIKPSLAAQPTPRPPSQQQLISTGMLNKRPAEESKGSGGREQGQEWERLFLRQTVWRQVQEAAEAGRDAASAATASAFARVRLARLKAEGAVVGLVSKAAAVAAHC